MYSVCCFTYTLVNSFCAFFSVWALVLVGFLLLHREAVYIYIITSAASVVPGVRQLPINSIFKISVTYMGTNHWMLLIVTFSLFYVKYPMYSLILPLRTIFSLKLKRNNPSEHTLLSSGRSALYTQDVVLSNHFFKICRQIVSLLSNLLLSHLDFPAVH